MSPIWWNLCVLKLHTWSENREPQVVHYVIHLGCDTTLFEEHKVCNLTSLYSIQKNHHSYEFHHSKEENFVSCWVYRNDYLSIYLFIIHKNTKCNSQIWQYGHIGAILWWYITTPLCANSQKTLKACAHNTSDGVQYTVSFKD